MRPTRIGLIGAGNISLKHLDSLNKFEDVKIAAIADIDFIRAKKIAEDFDAKAYGDHLEMLSREQCDAIYICTPPYAREEIEQAVIDTGLPFFLEKPLSLDLDRAEKILEQVEAKNLLTAVGYHWRYLDTLPHVSQVLKNSPARVVLGYWLDRTPESSWWPQKVKSGGQIVEQSTHIFDLARLLLGPVLEVHGAGVKLSRKGYPLADIDVGSVSTLKFSSGAVCSIASTCILHSKFRVGLEIFCEDTVIEFTPERVRITTRNGVDIKETYEDPYVLENRAFIDAVRGKSMGIKASYREALETHRLAIAATNV
jgi:predicted dehydrogenase